MISQELCWLSSFACHAFSTKKTITSERNINFYFQQYQWVKMKLQYQVFFYSNTILSILQVRYSTLKTKEMACKIRYSIFVIRPQNKESSTQTSCTLSLKYSSIKSSLLCLLHSISFVIKELYLLRKMPHNYMTRFQKSCTSYHSFPDWPW